MTIRHHYHDKLEVIKEDVYQMGMLTKTALEKASKALKRRDKGAAAIIIAEDEQINQLELKIENQCVIILATEQPVASNLRFLISTLKAIRDLERIGDYAAHLAKVTLNTADNSVWVPGDIPRMTELCLEMLKATLTAYLSQDSAAARQIKLRDEEVDKKYLQLVSSLSLAIKNDPGHIKNLTSLVLLAKYLERLGDHITAICDEILYMCTGKRDEEDNQMQDRET